MIEYTISFIKTNGAFTPETIFVEKSGNSTDEQIELTNQIIRKIRTDKTLESVLDICRIGDIEEDN